MINVDKEKFTEICHRSVTMAEACRQLNMHWNTFKRYANKFGCYKPNQSNKGIKLGPYKDHISTDDILAGKYPNYQTYKLKLRLLREGYLEDKCYICGWSKKRENEEFSTCELHHIDGDSHNHSFDNLILICPNCHSLTVNYRSKNRAHNEKSL